MQYFVFNKSIFSPTKVKKIWTQPWRDLQVTKNLRKILANRFKKEKRNTGSCEKGQGNCARLMEIFIFGLLELKNFAWTAAIFPNYLFRKQFSKQISDYRSIFKSLKFCKPLMQIFRVRQQLRPSDLINNCYQNSKKLRESHTWLNFAFLKLKLY